MACLTAEAPVQVQKTFSHSYSAYVARDKVAASVCWQPHEHAVPPFMGHVWPPAPATHHTMLEQAPRGAPDFLPVVLPREPPYLAYSRWEHLCYGQGCRTWIFLRLDEDG
jgi:hypothetical protein